MENNVSITPAEPTQIAIVSQEPMAIEVQVAQAPGVVQIATPGPQGPSGEALTSFALVDLEDVDATQKVENSVLYYNAEKSAFVLDDVNTVQTLTDGGNF